MTRCDRCGIEVKKPVKVGPDMRYCSHRCCWLRALEQYPGTSLAEWLKTARVE